MSRKKVCSVVAGWLAVASVGLAQAPQSKSNGLSPYYPTASTVDRRGGEESDLPPEMPNVPLPRPSLPTRPASVAAQPPAAPPPAPLPAPTPVPAPPPVGVAPAPPVISAPPIGAYGPNGCGAAAAPTCNTACAPAGRCCPDDRVWASAEYLLWWTRGMHVPPLVTTSPLGTPRTAAGVLGDPRTRVLFGDENVNNEEVRSGFRVRAGFWLDQCATCGLEGSYFFLGRGTDDETFFPALNTPILARPFFNAANTSQLVSLPRPDTELVNFPGAVSGAVSVSAANDFHGFDANFRKNICCACDRRVDFLAGYRYLRLNDSLHISEDVTATDPTSTTIPVGTRFQVEDRFDSHNDFNGGQVGLAAELRRGRFVVGARGLVALGNSHKEVSINGATRITVPGTAPQMNLGGLLALPTNIGTFTRNDFAVEPEGTLTVGYQLTDGVRAFVGYTFIYWSNVWRAGDQIDLVVNPTQIAPGTLVGTPRPTFLGKDTDFWAQGVSFGLELRY
jgi:Putative beta barrel porin-7 (BBP7)